MAAGQTCEINVTITADKEHFQNENVLIAELQKRKKNIIEVKSFRVKKCTVSTFWTH